MISGHSYAAADLRSLIALAQRLTAERPPSRSYDHAGDVVWQLYALDHSDDVRAWFDDERAVALAIFEPPLNLQFDVDPASADWRKTAAEILAWGESRRALVPGDADVPIAYRALGERTVAISVLDDDEERIGLVGNAGYRRVEQGGVRFACSLDETLAQLSLPPKTIVRHVAEHEVDARAELHRDAWSVWGTSSFTSDLYRRLRSAPHYDPTLDIVAEHEGRIVSYCIGWLDDTSRIGYFEPVGTRPSATGRGYGRGVLIEGLRRMRDRGMRSATVGTASINPAAQALYRSVGFTEVGRESFWLKPLT